MSNSNPPLMVLPNHVDGIIDLKTLADIQRFLSQSLLEDDLVLAAWVKEHYLYEPITSEGREIRTTEGFSKLDRAYRRVRSLTNKAQDKWPFFDRYWKSMSSTTVRNNARGEAAPGVSLPGMSSAAHDSPMSTGQDARRDEHSAATSAFVSFGTSKPIRHLHYHQQPSSTRTVPNTPIPIPAPKKVQLNGHVESAKPSDSPEQPPSAAQSQPDSASTPVLPKYTDLAPSSETPMSAHSTSFKDVAAEEMNLLSEEPASRSTSATAVSEAPQTSYQLRSTTEEVFQDAGGNKVRGPRGRFMTWEEACQSTSSAESKPAKKRLSRSTRRKAARVKGAEFPTPLPAGFDDEIMVDAPSTPAPAVHSNSYMQQGSDDDSVPAAEDAAPEPIAVNSMDTSSDRSISEPASSAIRNDLSPYSLTLAYTLAAESDPVPSSLDKLPPNSFRKLKRKSEPTAQEGPRRKRGRPRTDIKKSDEQSSATVTATGVVKAEAPRMATRRTTRRSAVANLDQSAPAKPVPSPPSTKKQTQNEDREDNTMVNADDEEEEAEAGQKLPSSPPVVSKPPSPRVTRALASARSEAQLQSASSKLKDVSVGTENAEPVGLDMTKMSSVPKQSGRKKPVVPGPGTVASTPPNVTFKTPARSVVDQAVVTPLQSTPLPTSPSLDGTTPGTSISDTSAVQVQGKVEYFARVHTATGVVEVAVSTDDLSDDVEIIQQYADWAQKEGNTIAYQAFKSIFGFAKKG